MRGLLAILILLTPVVVSAQDKIDKSWSCWGMASQKHGVPIDLLQAIAMQESRFNPKAVGPQNKNGTYDIGLMQINSNWLRKDQVLGRMGVTKGDLLDPCINLHVGAWILKKNFEQFGYNWRAIGAYNARTEYKRVNYANNVSRHLKKIKNEAY